MKVTFLKCISVFAILFMSASVLGQYEIEATVIDQKTKSPIPYAYVKKKNTNRGAITNGDGFFRLNCTKSDTLVISFVSYEKQEIAAVDLVNKKSIYLQPSINELSTVEVYANFDFLYTLFDRARKNLKQSQDDISKTYFTLETSTQGFPVELLECYYNAEIGHSGINELALKNGRIGMSESDGVYFTSLNTTQIISDYRLMNKSNNRFPDNPLQLSRSKLAKAYTLKLLAFESGVYKISFSPKKKENSYFNSIIWINKEEEKIAKIQLNKKNLKKHPFVEINADDELDSLNFNITYTFGQQGLGSLSKIEFKYDLIYQGESMARKMESEGVFLFFEKNSLFDLPYYSETHHSLSDYDKIVSQPYNQTFWQLNKVISPSRKTLLYQNYFEKTGVLLNFDELSQQNEIFKNRVISWSQDRILVDEINKGDYYQIKEVTPNESLQSYKMESVPLNSLYNLAAHIYLDRTVYEDSVYYLSETLIDLDDSFYYLEMNKNTTCFINLYYDLVEINRRKLMLTLHEKSWESEEVDSIYHANQNVLNKEMELFLDLVERGEKDDKIKAYVGHVRNTLNIDNSVLIWSAIMADKKKQQLNNMEEWVRLYNHGTALLRIGEFEQSLPFLLEAEKQNNSKDPWVLYNIGINYIKLGEIDKGCEYLVLAKIQGEQVPKELMSSCK